MALAAVIGLGGCAGGGTGFGEPGAPPAERGPHPDVAGLPAGRITAVIDGDSIEVDGRAIRLIGVNAPERGQPDFAPSRDALQALLAGGRVRLAFDVERRDQFGRELAYVFLDDGRHVNAELVRAGFAQVYTIPPNVAHAAELRAAEREARAAGRGLWRPSDLPLAIADLQHDPPGPDGEVLNGEWVLIENRGPERVRLEGLVLSDESNNAYRFPDRELAPGGTVRVFTGGGRDTASALYWGRTMPVWNNDGDTAFLRDAEGRLVDRRSVERSR